MITRENEEQMFRVFFEARRVHRSELEVHNASANQRRWRRCENTSRITAPPPDANVTSPIRGLCVQTPIRELLLPLLDRFARNRPAIPISAADARIPIMHKEDDDDRRCG